MANQERGLRLNRRLQSGLLMVLSMDYICFSFSSFPIFGLNLPEVPRNVQCAFSILACIFALMSSTELGPFGVLGFFFLFFEGLLTL